jgi:hypothetical protein
VKGVAGGVSQHTTALAYGSDRSHRNMAALGRAITFPGQQFGNRGVINTDLAPPDRTRC